MMLYGGGRYHILTSKNLLNWKDEKNPIPNSFECPDFFELAVDGKPGRKKWVLIQGNGKYSIGTFDGTGYNKKTRRSLVTSGFLATQSWDNTETGDGRSVQAAWMNTQTFPTCRSTRR